MTGSSRSSVLALLGFALASTGCASIVRGTHQEIPVKTLPAGATVVHDATGDLYTSPATLRLERRSRHLLVVHKEGYQAQEVYIRSEANVGWWVIDAFSLGVGNLLDFLIGGLFDLKPARVYVALELEPAPAPGPDESAPPE